jgi:hypothetical protein
VGDWPILSDGAKITTLGAVTATTQGTLVTCGDANIKGAWVSLGSMVACKGLLLMVRLATNSRHGLVDFALSSDGSNFTIIIPNYYITMSTASCSYLYFPVSIPSGYSLYVRGQADVAAAQLYVEAFPMQPGFMPSAPLSKVTTYGALSSGQTRGTAIVAGTPAHTKGAWVAIGTLAAAAKWLILDFGYPSATGNAGYLFDLGIGPSGSEIILIPDFYIIQLSGNLYPPSLWFPVQIPNGTQISVRSQSTTALANLDIVIHAVN